MTQSAAVQITLKMSLIQAVLTFAKLFFCYLKELYSQLEISEISLSRKSLIVKLATSASQVKSKFCVQFFKGQETE